MDCTDTEKLINNEAGERKKFILLALLTKLHLECLKLLQENDRFKFPKKQEEFLLNKIKDQISNLKSDLRQLDAEHLKFIQLALDDYKNLENVRFNKLLTEYLVSSYQEISKSILNKPTPLEFKNEKETQKGKILEDWKKIIVEFNNDKKINKNNLEKTVFDRVQMYFDAKRDVDSLNKIYAAINSFEEYSKMKGTILEKRLVMQTMLQKLGEFLKSTSDTPNLSKKIRESLEQNELPVKLLTNLRDQLMHHQIFPLKIDSRDINKLVDDGLNPIKIIIADHINEINKNFILSLMKEITDEKIKKNVDFYDKKSVTELIQYIEEIKNIKVVDQSPTAINNKKLIDEIYEYALSIKSENNPSMPDSAKSLLNEKKSKIRSTIEASLQKSRFKVSEDINKELASWNLSLDKYSSDVSKIDKVVGYLEGDIPFDKNKKMEVESDLRTLFTYFHVLDKINVRHINRVRISLKTELEEYFDPEGFINKDYYSKKTKIEDLITVLNSVTNNKNELYNFLDASKKGASFSKLKPDEYERLVKDLQLSERSEEKLLSYLVEWRKNKCIDLLKNKPLAFKVIRDAIAGAKNIPDDTFNDLADQYKPKNEDKSKTKERAKDLQTSIIGKVKEFYLRTTKEMIKDLNSFSQYDAVHMQFVSIYSVLERFKDNKGDSFMIRTLRNHLGHDGQSEKFKEQFIKLIKEAVNKIDLSKEVTIFTFNKAVFDSQFDLKLSEIQQIVSSTKITGSGSQILHNSLNFCVTKSRSRTRRSINNCLFSKEDVEKFSKNLVQESDVNSVEKIIIDSEKFLTYVKSSQDERKNSQLLEFVQDKNFEGDYIDLVHRVIQDQGYDHYIQNERINNLFSDISQKDARAAKFSKLKGRLINAAGRIQLIRGVHGTFVSCKDGTATDCGFAVGGIAWSFASQPIENVIVTIASKNMLIGHLVGKMIPGTLGIKTRNAIRFLGTKVGGRVVKGVAGAVGGIFDIIDIGRSISNLIDCNKRENSDDSCTEKDVRDEIVSIAFSGVSFVSGIALVAVGMPGIGTAVGFGLMVGQGIYSGISNIVEYKNKYDTTKSENLDIFLNTVLLLPIPHDVEHLATRNDIVDSQAKRAWKNLGNSSPEVIAYGIGFGRDTSLKSLRPGVGKIFMNRTDADTTNISRVIPKLINDDAEMICLPQVTEKIYEKNMKQSVPTAVHYCENAMVVVDKKRKIYGTTIMYDLENMIGTVVGSNTLINDFLIFDQSAIVIGGNNTVNRYVFLKPVNTLTSIHCGHNATNLIDFSQLKDSNYPKRIDIEYNCVLNDFNLKINDHSLVFGNNSIRNFDTSNYYYVGRQNKADTVSCFRSDYGHVPFNVNCGAFIDGGGGSSYNEKDIIDNCKKVTVSPYTTVTGSKGNYTFYIKTTGYKSKDLHSEIDVRGEGVVIFSDINLLSDFNEITYSMNNNTLSLKMKLNQYNNEYILDIKNYISQISNQPNFALIDKNGCNIVPKIVDIDSLVAKIDSFEVHMEHSFDSFDLAENYYNKIFGDNKNYKIFGVVRNKVQGQSDDVLQSLIFGSSVNDIINFDQNMFSKGGDGRDLYILDDNIKKREVIVDNYAIDNILDALVMPEVPEEFSIQKCNLHLNHKNTHVQIKNYFKENTYRHLMFMNNKGETFIPYMKLMSCVNIFEEKGKIVPFFHASPTQNVFLLSKNFKGNYVVIDSLPKEIEKYKDKDDLLLTREGPIFFVIKIEDFYNNQSKWKNVNFIFWNNGTFSQNLDLFQEIDKVLDYQEKISIDYKKSIQEYVIDFTKSENIIHNQGKVSTVVENDEKLIGVIIIKNITPDRIQVSSSGQDLIFSDKVTKHVINVKNWNVSEFYRISELEFDVGLEPIFIRRLDELSLFDIKEIQNLVDQASKVFQSRFVCSTEIDAKNIEERTPLFCAAANGQLDAVETLITKRPAYLYMKDKYGRSPLHVAASVGHIKVVNKLLEHIDSSFVDSLDNEFKTPLHYASKNGHLEIVEKLIQANADVDFRDKQGYSPLYLSAQEGHLDVVKKLIESKANVNILNKGGYTPLYTAVQYGHLNVTEKLIQSSADVNARSFNGTVPLHIAAQNGYINIVEKLIENNADFNVISNNYSTPLHFAARYGHLNVVKYLLSKKVNINAGDDTGETPLHKAARYGHLEVVKYLISEKANINSVTIKGKTSLDYAIHFNKKDVIEYLKKKLNETNGVSKQRRRRHLPEAHVDYLSRKPLAIDLNDQPRVESSNTTIPSSWIDGAFNWAKNSVSGLFSSKAVSSEETLFTTHSSVQVNPPINVDNCLILLDFFARKLTGQKYVSTANHVTSAQEAESCAINIIDGFRKIVEQAALKCDIKMHRFNFNFEKMQEEVAGKIIGDKLDEISTVIKTHVEKASPGREAGCIGRLSQKKFNKFMIDFNSRLNIILHQEIQSILLPEKIRLGISDEVKNSQTKNYLNNSLAKTHQISDGVLKLK